MILSGLFRNELGKISYAGWEWLAMRVLFAPLIWLATWKTFRVGHLNIRDAYEIEKANGLPALIDLTWLGQPVPTSIAAILMAVLLAAYLWGRWMLPVTGGLLLIHSAVGGIEASPVGSHHATQIVGLVLVGQFAWYLWAAIRKGKTRLDSASGAIFWSQQLICAGYVVSAISKWINSGGGLIPGANWIAQVPNIPVQFEKNQLQAFYDHLELPANAELNNWTIQTVIEHPILAMTVFGTAFYLEFFAFLALWNRGIGAIYGLALVAMHLGIAKVMHLPFYYFEATVLIFFVNFPFWLAVVGGWMRGRNAEAADKLGGPNATQF